MSEYRPRPDDHLVEPLFGGLRDADEAGSRGHRRGRILWVLFALAGVLVLWWTFRRLV
jgi:hypothetical protein